MRPLPFVLCAHFSSLCSDLETFCHLALQFSRLGMHVSDRLRTCYPQRDVQCSCGVSTSQRIRNKTSESEGEQGWACMSINLMHNQHMVAHVVLFEARIGNWHTPARVARVARVC
jgi:hypothetical protein